MNNKKKRSSAHGIAWDLSALYRGIDDPQIQADLDTSLERARAFEQKYKGSIHTEPAISAATLCEVVQEFESIEELMGKTGSYASLVHAAKSDVAEHGALVQRASERGAEVNQHLIFFELEWLSVPDDAAEKLIRSPELARYGHFLEKQRVYREHKLTEAEEKILNVRNTTGPGAFQRLFSETNSRLTMQVVENGESREVSLQEGLAYLYRPERELRETAATGLTNTLKRNEHLLTFIFNTLVQDKKTSDGLRNYDGPADSRHLANEIDAGTVNLLIESCESRHDLVHRYYRLKAKMLGIDGLKDYDRYAPVFEKQPNCEWDRCKEVVSASYHSFSSELGNIVDRFFNENWIDAELRDGKRGGAFSASTVPGAHPYNLLNYTDNIRDVMTCAHELGHGVHQYLAREAGYLQQGTPLTMAETASTFGEMVTFYRLLEEFDDPAVIRGLICSKIENAFATVFRQIVLTRFEQKAHHARREEGELPTARINELWMAANQPMHGDTVELTEGYGYWWMYIPHFIHTPFYCYAYSFGELLVFALYKKYKEEGEPFVPKYLDMLRAGGSESPKNLLAKMDIDVATADFWLGGLKVLEQLVERAEQLA